MVLLSLRLLSMLPTLSSFTPQVDCCTLTVSIVVTFLSWFALHLVLSSSAVPLLGVDVDVAVTITMSHTTGWLSHFFHCCSFIVLACWFSLQGLYSPAVRFPAVAISLCCCQCCHSPPSLTLQVDCCCTFILFYCHSFVVCALLLLSVAIIFHSLLRSFVVVAVICCLSLSLLSWSSSTSASLWWGGQTKTDWLLLSCIFYVPGVCQVPGMIPGLSNQAIFVMEIISTIPSIKGHTMSMSRILYPTKVNMICIITFVVLMGMTGYIKMIPDSLNL